MSPHMFPSTFFVSDEFCDSCYMVVVVVDRFVYVYVHSLITSERIELKSLGTYTIDLGEREQAAFLLDPSSKMCTVSFI